MKTFKEFINENLVLLESISDHAKQMMRSGKYDPNVRGSGSKFKKDLIASGKTSSPTTANIYWKMFKSFHQPASTSTVKPVEKQAEKPVKKSVEKPVEKVSHPAPAKPISKPTVSPKSSASVTTREGHVVKAGDAIGFKRGYEQYATVHHIEGHHVHADQYDSDTGHTHRIILHKDSIWKE